MSNSATPWTVAQPPPSMEFSRHEYWNGLPFPSLGDLLDPGIKPGSPALQADSLPAEAQGKPKNTGVGSLSLLQWIFPTQDSSWGLLHCRWILYQLSYPGSPNKWCCKLVFLFFFNWNSVVLQAISKIFVFLYHPSQRIKLFFRGRLF